jgi:hypothetical protein
MIKIKGTQFEQMCKFRKYTLEEVSESIIKKDGEIWYVDDEHKDFPHSHGVGAELKKILRLFGIKATPNCSCNQKALEMDARGIQWCKDNREKIIGWLEEEATKRKLPFIKFAAEQALNLAIKRASKNPRSNP